MLHIFTSTYTHTAVSWKPGIYIRCILKIVNKNTHWYERSLWCNISFKFLPQLYKITLHHVLLLNSETFAQHLVTHFHLVWLIRTNSSSHKKAENSIKIKLQPSPLLAVQTADSSVCQPLRKGLVFMFVCLLHAFSLMINC